MTQRRFCILVNPTAGYGRALHVLNQVEAVLTTLPIQYRMVVTRNIEHAQETAIHAIQQGEYIAIFGGDGTARAIAGIVHNMQGVLALLPAGRGNDIFRMLKIPLDPIKACQLLAYGSETPIDMARVNEQPFLGICSLGFDSVATQIANNTRFIKGRAVYLYGGLRALISWKPIQFQVEVDGKAIEHVGYTVAVANSQLYGGGMLLAPHASMQDGLLDVVLIGDIPKFRMLVNVPRVFKGTHTKEPGFEILRGKHIKIMTESKFAIYADGDFISGPPAEINIMPNAVRILVAENLEKKD